MTDFANSERSQRVNVANLQNSQLSQILKVRLEQHGDVVPLQIPATKNQTLSSCHSQLKQKSNSVRLIPFRQDNWIKPSLSECKMDFMAGSSKGISYEMDPVRILDVAPLYSIKSLNQMLRRVAVYNQPRIFRINRANLGDFMQQCFTKL
jgi:hypothetical protein